MSSTPTAYRRRNISVVEPSGPPTAAAEAGTTRGARRSSNDEHSTNAVEFPSNMYDILEPTYVVALPTTGKNSSEKRRKRDCRRLVLFGFRPTRRQRSVQFLPAGRQQPAFNLVRDGPDSRPYTCPPSGTESEQRRMIRYIRRSRNR